MKVGIVGGGGIAQDIHCPVIKGIPGAKIVGVADKNVKVAEALTSEFQGNAYDDLEKMIDAES